MGNLKLDEINNLYLMIEGQLLMQSFVPWHLSGQDIVWFLFALFLKEEDIANKCRQTMRAVKTRGWVVD